MPAGVPVAIRSPGSSVMMPLMNDTSDRESRTACPPTGARCRSSPFTRQITSRSRQSRPVATRGPDRAEGVEALGAPPLAVRLLQVAAGDVVEAGEAGDGALRLAPAEPAGPPADDHPDLRLVLHPLRGRAAARWCHRCRSGRWAA